MSEVAELRKLIESLYENNEPHNTERFDRELQAISDHIQRVAQEMKTNGLQVHSHMWKMVKYFGRGVDGVTKKQTPHSGETFAANVKRHRDALDGNNY